MFHAREGWHVLLFHHHLLAVFFLSWNVRFKRYIYIFFSFYKLLSCDGENGTNAIDTMWLARNRTTTLFGCPAPSKSHFTRTFHTSASGLALEASRRLWSNGFDRGTKWDAVRGGVKKKGSRWARWWKSTLALIFVYLSPARPDRWASL